MILIRHPQGEISVYTGKLKHPISAQAYANFFDSAPFLNVTEEQYNAIPAGKSLQGSVNLGALGGITDPEQGDDVIR